MHKKRVLHNLSRHSSLAGLGKISLLFPFSLLFLLLISCPIFGATVHGVVYDLSLDKISGVIIELNTTPQQRVISTDGEYLFEVGQGSYKIIARQVAQNLTLAKAEEYLQIVDDGDYTLDLFLYPSLEEEESLINDTDIDIDEGTPDTKLIYPALILIILLLLALIGLLVFIYFRSARKPKKEEAPFPAEKTADDYPEKVLQIISQEGGRTTQKDIRKQLPLSEAKVSLIIAELEAKGKIEKIKKGRGNIIVLKKTDK